MGLSRWQRIGVMLSVLWAVGAFLTITKLAYDQAMIEVSVTHKLCNEAKADSKRLDCARQEEKTWDNWTDGTTIYAIVVAIFPIPFVWAIADVVVWMLDKLHRRRKSHDDR